MEDKSDWTFLDDVSVDLRSHTLMQGHPRNRHELFASLQTADMDYLRRTGIINADGNFIHHKVDKDAIRDPDHVSEESQAVALHKFGGEYVNSLDSAVGKADQILFAAPPRARAPNGVKRSIAFEPRHPKFIPERHQPYLDAGRRNFAKVARSQRRSTQHASRMLAELSLVFLTEGRAPSWSVISSAVKHPPEDEAPLASSIFKPLWDQHERCLKAAEESGVFNTAPLPPLSKKGKLLAGFYMAATTLKLTNDVLAFRDLMKALGRIIDDAREEYRNR